MCTLKSIYKGRFNDLDISWKSTSQLTGTMCYRKSIVLRYSEKIPNNGKSRHVEIKTFLSQMGKLELSV